MAAAEERERRIAILQQDVDSLKARLWDSAARIGDLEKCVAGAGGAFVLLSRPPAARGSHCRPRMQCCKCACNAANALHKVRSHTAES